MTDTPRPWDRLPTETPKSYAAFLAYVALGARRSVREAARQHHSNTTATGKISSVEDTTVRTWMGWSARHKWAFTLQHPPVQQVEDVTRIEDLPDLSDADLGRMRAIRDEARQKDGVGRG